MSNLIEFINESFSLFNMTFADPGMYNKYILGVPRYDLQDVLDTEATRGNYTLVFIKDAESDEVLLVLKRDVGEMYWYRY